jgi:hypothetical protein
VDVAEAAHSRLARRHGIHARRDEFARPHLHVEIELGIDFLFEAASPQARTQGLPEFHALSG